MSECLLSGGWCMWITYHGNALLTLCSLVLVTGASSCSTGYISRTDIITQITTVCCKVTCPPNSRVKECAVNSTSDICEPCPSNTYLLDKTSSDLVKPCIEHICPEDTRKVFYMPKYGCRMPCECDTTRKMVGLDACNCIRSDKTCDPGMELTLNNTCQPIRIATEVPEDVIRIPRNNVLPGQTADTPIDPKRPGTDDQDHGILINIIVAVVCSFLLVSASIGVVYYVKKRLRPSNDERSTEAEVPLNNGEGVATMDEGGQIPVAIVSPVVKNGSLTATEAQLNGGPDFARATTGDLQPAYTGNGSVVITLPDFTLGPDNALLDRGDEQLTSGSRVAGWGDESTIVDTNVGISFSPSIYEDERTRNSFHSTMPKEECS